MHQQAHYNEEPFQTVADIYADLSNVQVSHGLNAIIRVMHRM